MNTYQEKYVSNFMVVEPEEIRKKTQRLIKTLAETLAETDFTEINRLLQETKSMSYSIQGYLESLQLTKPERDMLMHAGYNSALLDMMRLYTASLYAQEEIQKVKTKYRDMILRILDRRGTLLHKDLAAELMTTPNNLTAIIKQMNATPVKLIHVEVFSKFKAYSLTPVARQYIEKSMQNTPVKRKPRQRSSDYNAEIEVMDVPPDGRFDEQDLRNDILPFRGKKYNKKIFILSEKKRQTMRTGSHKFTFDPDTYNTKRA